RRRRNRLGTIVLHPRLVGEPEHEAEGRPYKQSLIVHSPRFSCARFAALPPCGPLFRPAGRRAGFLPVPFETAENRLVVCLSRPRLTEDHEVPSRQLRVMLPEGFAHEALQAVPAACEPAMFPRYRKPEPGVTLAVVARQDREQIVAAPVCV